MECSHQSQSASPMRRRRPVPIVFYGQREIALNFVFIGGPEAGTIRIFDGYQPPERTGRKMPEPSISRLGWLIDGSIYLLANPRCDLVLHPGQEAVALP